MEPTDPNLWDDQRDRICGQNAVVLELLQHGPITPSDAMSLGITRLAARIHDLRKHGVSIVSRRRGHVAEYRLEAHS